MHRDAVVYSTLIAINGAGDAAVFRPPPVRLVAPNCTTAFYCLPPAAGVHPLRMKISADSDLEFEIMQHNADAQS